MGCQEGILTLLLVFLCIAPSLQSDESLVPVLIWNYKNTGDLKYSHNSLHNVDTPSFTSHLQKLITKSSSPLVLAFIEPTLSVEDFSSKATAFSNVKDELSRSKLVDYITSVNDASQGIRNLAEAGLRVKEISDTLSIADNIDELVDVLVVKLSEADDNRFNTLQKHDRFISEAYRQVYEQRKNVIGVLTSEVSLSSISSLFRYRRAAEGASENKSDAEFLNNVFAAGNKNGRAMMYSKTPAELILPTGNKYILAKDNYTEAQLDDRTEYQRLIITHRTADNSKIKLRFRFDKGAGNMWTLKNVEIEAPKLDIPATNLTTANIITSAIGSKFTTTKELEFSNGEGSGQMRLLFPAGFTVQPFLPDKLGLRFGDAADTLQYFTPGIWMGIFVMAILSLVFTVGLVMMMDIRTMDRFDDAKGKTITINSAE